MELGGVAHNCAPSTQEAEAGEVLQFEACLAYRVRSSLRDKQKQKKGRHLYDQLGEADHTCGRLKSRNSKQLLMGS